MVGHVLIRAATSADAEVLQDVFRRSSLSIPDDRDVLLANPDALDFEPNPATRVACTDDGRIVGFATGLVNGGVMEVEDLFVAPEEMRQGVGRALVTDLVTAARNQGIDRLEVTVNHHALPFYEALGFVPCGEAETRFGPALRLRLAVTRS